MKDPPQFLHTDICDHVRIWKPPTVLAYRSTLTRFAFIVHPLLDWFHLNLCWLFSSLSSLRLWLLYVQNLFRFVYGINGKSNIGNPINFWDEILSDAMHPADFFPKQVPPVPVAEGPFFGKGGMGSPSLSNTKRIFMLEWQPAISVN